jgi:beta-glucosidase
MKKSSHFRTLFILLLSANAGCVFGQVKLSDAAIDQQVESLISQMTLEEKAGQMTNIGLMAIAEGDFWMKRDTVILDPEKMNDLLLLKHVGSVQNLGGYPFSTQEWRRNIAAIQDLVMSKSRLKIPVLYGIDGVHGANYTKSSTLLPHQLALAATWNPQLAKIAGEITSYEIRASGIPWNYSPVLDVCKQLQWGRVFETFGEDTYLTSIMGEAMIEGMQGKDISDPYHAAVCLKHFIGYGMSANGKDRTPVYMPEHLLRQICLPPFQKAIDLGVSSIMINSGSVNGVPCHADKYLITDLLKGELGFEGFTISDWEDVMNLVSNHQVAKDEREAVKLAVNAGLDVCMEPYDASFAINLVDLVKSGEVSMDRVNDAARRILKVKYKLGLFENQQTDANIYPKFASEEFAQAAYETAQSSMTLLKNKNDVLPFSKDKKVFITGVAANSINYLNGGWSRTWRGVDTSFNDMDKLTVYQAFVKKLGKQNVSYLQGTFYDRDTNTAQAVEMAKKADYIVVCLGEIPATEKPSDIEDMNLPQAQLNLVKELAKTGKPIVLVLIEARPRIITEVEGLADGILMAYLPGNEGGRAIADVVFGDYNPSGKLPITYPRFTGAVWSYDHTKSEERDVNFGYNAFNPLYEFGFGLSYTTFEYSNLKLSKDSFNFDDNINITVDLKNTGSRSGAEVVQLYSSDLVASMVPAVKQLRRFQKVDLKPGQSQTITFTLNQSDLSFVNRENKTITEEGDFKFSIANLSKTIHLKK